jgi:hypothetical protein
MKNPSSLQQQAKQTEPQAPQEKKPQMSFIQAVVMLVLIFAAAPFLSLSQGLGALITLFIIFIGLQRAWRLTARSEILVMGPYELEPAA